MTRRFTFGALCFLYLTSTCDASNNNDVEEESRLMQIKRSGGLIRIPIRSNTRIRTIPATLFGLTPTYHLEKDKYWQGDTKSGVDQLRGGFWRYPGGEVTSFYHFENPNGKGFKDSWDPSWDDSKKEPSENWMSLDEYWINKEKVGAEALIGVNARSGWKWKRDAEGLAEASRLAKYVVETKGWDVNYWFLDNEQYLKDVWSQALYAHYINIYAAQIKNYQPDAKFVANWDNSYHSWKSLLANAAGTIDMMDLHVYWNRDGWGSLEWSHYTSINEMTWQGYDFRKFVDNFKNVARDYGRADMEIGFLEWGIGPSPTDKTPSRYQTGLMTADMFMQMIDSNLDTACYWPYRVKNSKAAAYHRALVDENNNPTFVQKVLSLFQTIKGYNLVSSNNDARVKTIAAINDYGDRMVVYVLLKGNSPSRIILNDFDGFKPTKVFLQTFSSEDTNVDGVPLRRKRAIIDDLGRTRFVAGGWSLSRVILTK